MMRIPLRVHLALLALLSVACTDDGGASAIPAPPTSVTVTSGPGVITVSWEHDGASATGFTIYREATATGGAAGTRTFTDLADVAAAARSYRDEGVAVGTSYRYAVAAQGSGGRQSPLAEQAGAPLEPEPVEASIADYVVGPGQVATVTSIDGVIDAYDGGATNATFAGLGLRQVAIDPDGPPVVARELPWVDTFITADGSFTIDLPAVPDVGGGSGLQVWCAADARWWLAANVVVVDGVLGEAGSELVAEYGRTLAERPAVIVEGLGIDPSVWVWYAFTEADLDIDCTNPFPDDLPGITFDVDMKLRPGWNVLHFVLRQEGPDRVWYARTGEPDLTVPWIDVETWEDIAFE